MVIEPCAHFTFLVLDGRQLPLLFFDHIGKTGEAQALRPDPDSSMRRDVAGTGRDPAVAARVTHAALDAVRLIDTSAPRAFVVEPARTVFQCVKIGDRERFKSLLHFLICMHCFPPPGIAARFPIGRSPGSRKAGAPGPCPSSSYSLCQYRRPAWRAGRSVCVPVRGHPG